MSMSTKEGAPRRRSPAPSSWTSRVIVGERLGVENPPEWFVRSYEEFRKNVIDPAFPCFFGTTAERRGEMFYAFVNGDDWAHLAATMAHFSALSRMPQHQRCNFALFFEPREVPLDHAAYRTFCWKVLQHLHDADAGELELDVDPTDPAWEFAAFGQQMFVVGCSPSYKNRRSRNLGPGIVMLFQPRAVFIDQVTKRAIGEEARAEVRRRLLAWDDFPHHPDMGVYGDPTNLEWRQYFIDDANDPEVGVCPFRQRRKTTPRPRDLASTLRERARTMPERVAAQFIPDAGGPAVPLTYAELDAHARRLAMGLLAQAEPGDRALVLAPSGLEYVTAMFACFYAGIIAVPGYPVTRGNAQHFQRLVGMMRDARPRLLLVDAASEAHLANFEPALLEGTVTVVVRSDGPAVSAWEPPALDPASIAFLQYTSGSTGLPKGVMVSHANLMANCTALTFGMALGADDVMVSWLPLFHDMGLIGTMLCSVHAGIPFVFMSPHRVMQSPTLWLKAIAEYGGTVSGGPNFAYQLCVDRAKDAVLAGLDLRRWRLAFCGSEPIRAATMEAFVQRFEPCGFGARALAPAYGLAEATLVVSVSPAGSGMRTSPLPLGGPLVECGPVVPGHRVRIADPVTGRECEEGSTGEIWVSGPSVTAGYWKNAEATAKIFRTVVHEDGVEERFLRTSDLGFVQRGRLFVNGRVKDTLVVRGQNVYPQDIEQTIYERVPSVRKGRASVFPFVVDGIEGIGFAVEASPAQVASRGADEILRAIARAISGEHQMPVELGLLLRPGALPRTSSGKLRRSACVPEWHAGAMAPLSVYRREEVEEPAQAARVAPRTATEHALASLWSEILGLRNPSVHADFFEAGGDSLRAARLLARIQGIFPVELAMEAVFEARTIAEQAARIDAPSTPRRQPIARRTDARAPLSHGQRALWFLWKLHPASTAYTLSATLRLIGPLDAEALRAAFAMVLERHEVLRARFEEIDGVPWQVTAQDAPLPWEAYELGETSASVAGSFDLERGPVARAALVQVAPEEHELRLAVHHIVADGWSVGTIWRELSAFYASERDGVAPSIDALPIQFGDYAAWERSEERTAEHEAQLAYWRGALAEVRPTEAPGRRSSQGAGDAMGRAVALVPPEATLAVRRLAQRAGATLSVALLAALDVLLHRYSGEREIVVGVATAGRRRPETESLVGYFVNTVVHRATVPPAATFAEVLAHVLVRAGEERANQDVPFERVVAALQPQRRHGEAPFFDVVFNHLPADVEAVRLPGLGVAVEQLDAGAPFDWTLHARESGEALALSLEYRAGRYDGAVAEQVLGDYVALLEQAVADAGTYAGGFRLTSVTEVSMAPPFRSVLDRFADQVRDRGDALAVTCEGASIDYRRLAGWSHRLAARLEAAGVRPDECVGLCVGRSIAVVAGMLGIQHAGAAFVPLDPAYPVERLRAMLDDASVRCVVADAASAQGLREVLEGRILVSVTDGDGEDATVHGVSVHPEQLAYVMFTSGSSGRPKGVEVSHRALALHLDDYTAAFELGARDVVLQFSTISFDAAVEQIFPALAAGARLVMRGPEIWSWAELNATLERERVSLAFLATGYWQQWLHHLPAHPPASLRRVRVGGEALGGDAVGRWRASSFGAVRLDNCYGPTECAVSTSAHATGADDVLETAVPIGKSFTGRCAYVLDPDGNDVPPGGIGELCLGGASLARGYAGQPSLTALRFAPEPARPGVEAGGRVYRTGDRCRRRLDGTLEFLGRLDDQVKLRGYRIELGEIETALRAAAGVTDAVAVLHGEGERRFLVAYVVGGAEPEAMRRALARVLPAHMVPQVLVPLASLPRLPNGKLDRRALPAPDMPRAEDTVAPRTEREEALLAIWKQVLGRDDVGTGDDFFALGGDSIASLQVVARARDAGLSISVRQVFERPTVAELAVAARACDGIGKSVEESAADVYPATPVQEGLLFHDAFEESGGVYVSQGCLTLRGELDRAALRSAWEAAVARHEVLRTSFAWQPEGGASQTVHRDVVLPYDERDASGLSMDAYAELAAEARAGDVARGFELGAAPLMRITGLVRPDGGYDLVWTYHHALLDGWSASRIVAEVLEDHASRGEVQREPAPPYRHYVAWLRGRPSGEAWWRTELARWDAPATVGAGFGRVRQREPGTHHMRRTPGASRSEALKAAAARAKVTVNTLMQGAWAIVLARHADRAQAVFGVTVAGRPSELAGVERMVGLFINTLPMCLETPPEARLDAWLRTVQQRAVSLREHEDTRAADVQKWAGRTGEPLFDSVLVYENHPLFDVLGARSGGLAIENVATMDRTHYPLTLTVYPRRDFELEWEWDGARMERAWIERLAAGYLEVLSQISEGGDLCLGELVMGQARAQTVLAYRFDAVGERVSRASREHGEKEAVWCEGTVATYGELERWSNRVGHALVRRGVKRDELVGLCVERSVGLVAGLLGVWKSGGAFVPLDPTYPEERLREMLSGIRVVVCDGATAGRFADAEVVRIDEVGMEAGEGTWGTPHSEQLAYVIYTSGSTGRPKGVGVSHRSLSLHVDDFVETYGIGAEDRVLFSSTINFDVSLHELLPVLTRGGRSVMRGKEAWELEQLTTTLREQGVTFARVSTAYWQQWVHRLPEALPKLRQVTVGGEGLAGDALARWFAGPLSTVKLDNLYGPTETTVASHRHRTQAADGGETIVPIGQTFPGRTSYVMDRWGNGVPPGGVGELCIGGASVARGYLERPSLTAERFVPDPQGEGGRLYRSGDVCRERADGVLEFLGRGDAQIKLRGYRIELGEIETALRRCEGVTDAVVEVKGEGESRRLVGYVTGTASIEALRAAAEQKLPSYMVPSAFVVVDALPLLPNGKVNRRALPEPDVTDTDAYVAPRTVLEATLQTIWQAVLKREPIGVTANFFDLGGDSILSLQIIARAREAGWKLTPRQLFEQPTIASCARAARPHRESHTALHEVLRGDIPLTPIQARFFERHPSGPAHWNQSILLRVRNELRSEALEQALVTLVARHDALRLRFTRHGTSWTQRVAEHETNTLSEVIDLLDPAHLAVEGERLQRSLNLQQGPLLRAAYFRLPDGERRLLLVVHHLAVDGVSWRILLDELAYAYPAIVQRAVPEPPPPSAPWSIWASRLREYATSDAVTAELPWWHRSLAPATRFPRDAEGDRTYAASREIVWTLNAAETQRLFDAAPRAYRMRVDEVLLTALVQAIASHTGDAGALVELEGHGREDVIAGVDVSRTLGWFTTRYPVWIEAAGDAGTALVDVKERLRAVPQKGLRWGLLDTGHLEVPRPAIGFNYLGRFDGEVGALFTLADEFAGDPIDPATEMGRPLDLNAMAQGGSLRVSWRFLPAVIGEDAVRGLVAAFEARLRVLVDHAAIAPPAWTASDFPLARLTQASLEAMTLPLAEVQDIYPATPVQQGLVFESLVDPSRGAYINQLRVTLRGPLDVNAFRAAWTSAVARHDILRTHFEFRHGGQALQVVHRAAGLPFAEHDWSETHDYEARLQAFCASDLARGFATDAAPLLRIHLFRRPDGAHDLVRTSHHALSDGWSAQRLFGEIFTEYAARRAGRSIELPAPVPYRDYVVWLQARPSPRAFWEAKFRDVVDPASVSTILQRSTLGGEAPGPIEGRLDASLARRVREAARQHQITLNTLVQAAWALVLARMAGARQALFGATVSGRPPELDGVERMLGLFINTLPVVVDLPAEMPVGAWLQRLQREATELAEYEHTPLQDLQQWVHRTGDALFDSIVVFENYPVGEGPLAGGTGLTIEHVQVVDRTHYPLTLTVVPRGEDIAIVWSWDPRKVLRSRVAAMADAYTAILGQLAGEGERGLDAIRVGKHPHPSPPPGGEGAVTASARASSPEGAETASARAQGGEMARVMNARAPSPAEVRGSPRPTFNAAGGLGWGGLLLPQQIAERVQLQPHAEAISCEGERLTYAELDALANRIARKLGNARGERIGVRVERSVAMVAACLGIWKAGGAYVPLDPSYPEERLRAMVQAGGVRRVLAELDLDGISDAPVSTEVHPEELAYVMFTSGSTGEPKAVGIRHRALALHAADFVATYALDPHDVVYQFATINFDTSVEQIFPTLAAGARIVMRGPSVADWTSLHEVLAAEGVTVLNLSTAYWAQAIAHMREPLPALRVMLIGGEAATPDMVQRWHASALAPVRLTNGYGPTEITVTCTVHETTEADGARAVVPIGRAHASRRIYVLDADGGPVPLYGIGELCVGGDMLARGYLERPGATAAVFVPDPFVPGARIYRTGDICRVLEDGVFEFLGRRDDQIKLRGHRIELGEVEFALRRVPGVREAAALVRGAGDRRRLVGYVAGTVNTDTVIRALKEHLPPYMVPSAVVALPSMPLRPNGKVDRDALPEPEMREAPTSVAPRTDIERQLAGIWRDVLQRADLGVTDDFFALGGDSIASLRVVARARELGLGLTPKQVLEHPTIAELALAAGRTRDAEHREIHDALPLTPIQAWFFEEHPAGESHYNQAVLLRTTEDLSSAALERALDALVARHDALRLRFQVHEGVWHQRVAPEDRHTRLEVCDFRQETDWAARLEVEGERLQKSLNLQDGPLLRAAHCRVGEHEGRLLIVVHHLAVDGVSWRVLLDELATAYRQAARGEAMALPKASTPWSAWAKALTEYAARAEVTNEAAFWQTSLAPSSGALASDGTGTVGASREATLEFDAAWTRRLLDVAARTFRMRVDEVLITALVRTLAQPGAGLLVDLEGHGREDVLDGVDASRTLGWFTTQYPVWLEAPAEETAALRAVKERLRAVPHRGMHFGLLRHGADPATREAMRALPRPEVNFNYLGQFDAVEGPFAFARESFGPAVAVSSRLPHPLEVNALVTGGVLQVSFRYDPERLEAADAMVARFDAALRALVSHAATSGVLTSATDFPLASIAHVELDALGLDLANVEDIYPATPLQQGLLFHTLLDPEAYINELRVTIRGPLDHDAFRAAWRAAVSRHPILRTHFEWRHGGEPLQIVHRHVELPWNEAQPAAIDLARAPLMRAGLSARSGEDVHDFVWTSHHVLLDGWSVARLFGEVIAEYRGEPPAQTPPPFRQYVAWLRPRANAGEGAEKAWWRAKLGGVGDAAGLLDSLGASDDREAGRHEQRLDGALTARIVAFAQRHRVTLNTVMQAAWALVLSRHADNTNVLFGTTVAGRPAELPGVEAMLGLFINTVPVPITVSDAAPVPVWLRGLQDAMVELAQHEHTPLHELQRWAGRPGAALFDTLLVFENYPLHESARSSQDLVFEDATLDDRTHYPLTLSVTSGAALEVTWAWQKGSLDRPAVERLAAHLADVLAQLAQGDDVRVRDVRLASTHATATAFAGYAFQSVPARVHAQAVRQPEAVAVSSGGRYLTYAQLVAWSARIAHRLAGAAREERIGLCVERGVALPAALLGVLEAGAAYVPLDPSYPVERLAYMLEDARIGTVVADRASAADLAALFAGRRVLIVEEEDGAGAPVQGAAVQPAQIAYVLYTSGSTGAPKGVAVSHEALDRFLASTGERPGLAADDVWLSVTSPSFDISALEIYLPLITGARVEIAPREALADGAVLTALLGTSGATVMQATPTTWRTLVDTGWRGEAKLVALSGGEALPEDLARALLERGVTLWNMYGPTETTIWSSAARLEPGRRITLGEPLHDTVLRILDARGEPVPVGGVGELCIGGTNLARGYLGRPAMTADRFVPDPLARGRLYRTGDRCRLRADGTAEFLGRLDLQVKLRGHRIELGEVESALRALPGVDDAVVVVKGEGDRARLVGYVTGSGEPQALRAALAEKLPSIMVPSVLVPLEALPMTLNGKIARGALPEVDAREAYVAPRTDAEVALARLWAEVLGVDAVSARDDFFGVGGHSISAVRLVARIRRDLQRDLPLRAIFEHPVLADLAASLDRVAGSMHAIAARRNRPRAIPLSFAQERLWFLWKLEPESAAYTVGGALRLEGELDVPVLRAALTSIVARHESLRTRFEAGPDGTPLQIVSDAPDFAWTERDGEPSPDALARPFDLEHGPLFRAELAKRGPGDHVLVLAMHHIVSDGASVDRFLAELAAAYRGEKLEALPIQYADYALWERDTANGAAMVQKLAYWREHLGTEHPVLELPVDRPRRGPRSPRGARVVRELDPARVHAIDALARRAGVTRFVVLLAAFDVLLHRYAGERDIRVGIPVTGRRHVETEPLIGFFVNTVVHRAELRAAMPFGALLREVRAGMASALANQDVPFARVVDALRPERNLGQTPLFRVTFNYEEDDGVAPALAGLRVSPVPARTGDVAFDLMLDASSGRGRLTLSFGYATDLFDKATMARLLEDYTAILDAVASDVELRVSEIALGAVAPASVAAVHPFESVPARFARQVALRPDAVALLFQGQRWTYRELDAWSTRIGRCLLALGVTREEPVAVCIDRSAAVVAAILGILKAGAAYVPLDPRYPRERLADTVRDAGIRRVVLDAPSSEWASLDVVDVFHLPHATDDAGWHVPVQREQLAYVIYTSGSTGRPKGVGITHANVARLFDATAVHFGFGPGDVWTLFHSPSFDFSVWEIFGPLVYGGCLVVVPYATTRDPSAFHRLLGEEGVTVLNQTPSAFIPLMHIDRQAEHPLRDLRAVIFGGEKLDPALLAPWAHARRESLPRLVNMYGITETTVHVTHRVFAPADLEPARARSLIGAPIDDLELYVLDEGMNTVPVNGIGELYVGGAGLARAYLGRPGLTASRFVPDPRGGGRRLYASGDRARRLADGDIEYIGRADAQVKIRGYRIELGEIEAALRAHPAVREAVVVVRSDGERGPRLIAYAVPEEGALTQEALRGHAVSRLPGHMVPTAFVLLEALPLTTNGKLDRSALPEPGYDESGARTAPSTEMELRVAEAFAAVLGVPAAFVESDFFHLGGDSLAAVRVAARLSESVGRHVEVAAVFQHPAVRDLAKHLDEAHAADDGAVALMNDWLDSLT
ncbi:non-ribosomal peptide synthase/polyketide synthase [Pendulispora rubella]|uniref:Non-ribosomal peptide synthase/polyketide synthase n=1 Tax=Pendulispora rubella TaxID=2741070 RepID=A0ABZ2L3H3_9BACT